ncbi:adhesion G-protein coupled receptor G6-like isoform X2 [Halichondria panicea]|uniref:adhesion G-protein coupled receptor G6-like isoform X2 n=1 Tax=Halichondria panicea TaxID=6063 RepID=UPI00312B5FAA
MAGSKTLCCLFLLSVLLDISLGAGDDPTMDSIPPALVSFGAASYTFSENPSRTVFIQVVTSRPAPEGFTFSVSSVLTQTDFVEPSGGNVEFTTLFPAGETSVNLPVEITDDEVPLEEVETVIASLRLNNPPSTVQLGSPSMTSIEIVDNDLPAAVSFRAASYTFSENPSRTVFIQVVISRPAPESGFFFAVSFEPSGGNMEFTTLFPGGETSVNLPVEITDDEVPLEEVETLIASLRLNNPPSTVQLGSPSMTSIEIVDNDGLCPALAPIPNGAITYGPDTFADFDVDTVATHTCNDGFILVVGSETRTCLVGGRWSGLIPVCQPGCKAEVYQNHSWPNTALGSTALSPCPCVEVLGVLAGNVSRQCSGSISEGGMWKDELDLSNCETTLSDISRELCEITLGLSSNKTTKASNQIANVTYRPQNLTASQITLVTAIVEQVAEEAAINQEVRNNYLQAINNIQQANADVIYESQLAMNSSTRILASLETFLDNLNTSTVSTNSTSNQTVLSFETFAIKVQDLDPDSFQGQTFVVDLGPVEEAVNNTGVIDQDALMTANDHTADNRSDTDSLSEDTDNSTASLRLSPLILEDCPSTNRSLWQRLSYSVFLSDVLFLPENRSTNQVGSIVVAARLACLQINKTVLTVPVRTSFRIRMTDNVSISSCAVYKTQDQFGAWDTTGCREITSSNGRKDCECRQLGHFGILFDLNPTALPENLAIAVSAITYIGLGLSVVCLLVFMLTIFISKKLLADKQNQILINMSISLICLYFTFLIGGFTVGVPPLCGLMSALLQYFFLVFFSWTAVEAVWLYLKLVVIMGSQSLTSKFMLKAGLSAWLLPFIIVVISAGAGHQYYSNPYYCRPTEWPFYFGFILPFVIIYVFNWIVFVAIMVSICKHFRNLQSLNESSVRQQLRNVKKNLVIAMCLSVVLGLGWGLGLLSTSSDLVELSFTFQVIFSIFVGSQGVLVFILYGLRSTEFRQTWIKRFNKYISNTDNVTSFEKGSTNPRDNSSTVGVELSSVSTISNKQ